MKKILLTVLVTVLSNTIIAQARYDTLFFKNHVVEAVNILKSAPEAIECTYPNETVLTVIAKEQLLRVKYKSGRIEVCSVEHNLNEAKVDTIFYRNGDNIPVNVKRCDGETVEYTFPNETAVNTVYKSTIYKIKFSSGREEICSQLLKIKEITSVSQYHDVVVTYNADDTKGLEKVKELSRASGWGGQLAAGMGYSKAIVLLQKEAAAIGCGLILIHGSPNMDNTEYGAGTRVNASAYRLPQSQDIQKNNDVLSGVERSSVFEPFVDGSIHAKSEFEQKQLGRNLCFEILKDVKKEQLGDAKLKFKYLKEWYESRDIHDAQITKSIENLKILLE